VAFSMHDINTAARYANKIVLVHQGGIVDSGKPEKVLTDEAISDVFGVSVERVAVSTGETILFFYSNY